MVVRRLLHRLGYRYVLHDARLPGKPDLVFPSRRKVIFVHGCFWHGHSCGRGFRPATNGAFWTAKIERNVDRHTGQTRLLKQMGWGALTIWECETKPTELTFLQRRLVGFLDA